MIAYYEGKPNTRERTAAAAPRALGVSERLSFAKPIACILREHRHGLRNAAGSRTSGRLPHRLQVR